MLKHPFFEKAIVPFYFLFHLFTKLVLSESLAPPTDWVTSDYARLSESLAALSENSLGKRQVQSGGKCGPSANNAVCAEGLCCSQDGVCGVGIAFCGAPGCQLSYGPACDGNQTPTGRDTGNVPRPLFGSVAYGVDISHCSVSGTIALSFDDGPYIYTAELLDLLKANDVKATFFIVGNNGGKGQINKPQTGYPDLIRRMYAEGHQIGSHTWSHQDLSAVTPQQRRAQIINNEIALADILGFFPTYLRPPYTKWNQDALSDLKTLGYHVTNYDIDTRDWEHNYTYAQSIFKSILSEHQPASSAWISLAHDIQDKTVHGFAQFMIDQARTYNYRFVTVGECLGDPRANWYRALDSGGPFTPGSSAISSSSAHSSTSSSPSISSSSTQPTTAASRTVEAIMRGGNTTATRGTAATIATTGTLTSVATSNPSITTTGSSAARNAKLGLWVLVLPFLVLAH